CIIVLDTILPRIFVCLCAFSYMCSAHLFILLLPPPPRSTLFPYTTLFRSDEDEANGQATHSGLRSERGVTTYVCSGGRDDASHLDRKSTRLNSSHVSISYAVFCLKKKKTTDTDT